MCPPSTLVSRSKHLFILPSKRTRMSFLEMISPSLMPLWTWWLKAKKMMRLVKSRSPRPLLQVKAVYSYHHLFLMWKHFENKLWSTCHTLGHVDIFIICLMCSYIILLVFCLWIHPSALSKHDFVFSQTVDFTNKLIDSIHIEARSLFGLRIFVPLWWSVHL